MLGTRKKKDHVNQSDFDGPIIGSDRHRTVSAQGPGDRRKGPQFGIAASSNRNGTRFPGTEVTIINDVQLLKE